MTYDHTGPTKDLVLGGEWKIDDASPVGPVRRTLVSAAVWTVPALGVAIATPAAAASGSNGTAAKTKKSDLRNTYTAWNAQGGQKDVPGDNTFTADNGLFVHAKVTNDGPDTVTGITAALLLPHYSNQMNRGRAHYPVARNGWEYYTDYAKGTDNWVFTFIKRSLTLAPGESSEVVIDFWTIPDSGRTAKGIQPYVAFQTTDGDETNQQNNGKSTDNSYNVRT
ncbi:hypothetical protein C5C00_13690 [Rathayibacter rathayi]|uniref:hypothetical protein n=1 Tax=Rathayibacter rathayi TaxID=33887 RepID=UPI000CE7E43B|nr:hypothetical protein [Rathayibacter rathayi]PPG93559.1 hypothetical protein C5C00_13690 [Rathayibacter rathayi]